MARGDPHAGEPVLRHYLGQLKGVRGHDDKQVLTFQDGTTVFQQRAADGTIVTPAVSTATWSDKHNFYGADEGRWDTWVKDKGDHCMWYYTPPTTCRGCTHWPPSTPSAT